jgi:protein-serine/threonine kinase
MCIRRSTAEFCVLSALPNVICTLELLMDTKGDYCEVMEFCSGGDLHNLMRMVGTLKWQDADCNIKQLMRGAEYP